MMCQKRFKLQSLWKCFDLLHIQPCR